MPAVLSFLEGAKTIGPPTNYRTGWYVVVCSCSQFLSMPFARKKDAEAAAKAVANVIDWSESDPAIILEQLRKFGLRQLRKLMVEAMQW